MKPNPLVIALPVLLAVFLSSSEHVSSQTEDLDRIAPLIKDLRTAVSGKKSWDLAPVERVVQSLIRNDQFMAAGWWVDAAMEAVQKKKLPRPAKRSLFALRKDLLAKWRKKSPKALSLSQKLARHAESAVKKKNFKEGRRVAWLAARHLALFPNLSAERTLARARKKLEKSKLDLDMNQKMLPKHKEKTAELAAISTRTIRGELDNCIETYGRFGHAALYEILWKEITTVEKGKRARSLVKRLREKALAVQKPDALKLWVVGLASVEVRMAGSKAGSQTGADSEDPRDWKPMDLPVYPGDTVFLRVKAEDRKVSGMLEVLCIHATFRDKPLLESNIFATEATDEDSLGDLTEVEVGEKTSDSDLEKVGSKGAGGTKFGIRFSTETSESIRTVIYPLDPDIDAWFKKQGVSPIFIRAGFDQPNYVIQVPEPAPKW